MCILNDFSNKKFAFDKDNRSVCFQAPILISSAGHLLFVASETVVLFVLSASAAIKNEYIHAEISIWISKLWNLCNIASDKHKIGHDMKNIIDKD